MTVRFVAVQATAPGAAPPGIDPAEFGLAMLEDAYEVAAGLELVSPALVLRPDDPAECETVTWPGTPIVRAANCVDACAALHALGAEQAVLSAGDAPDLPGLLIGKLLRALGSASAAVCPATGRGGVPAGLTALAVRLPLPAWAAGVLGDGDPLDSPRTADRLRAAAPRRGLVRTGPGWHRVRTAADIALLDPGLEGWEATRALLHGRPPAEPGLG